MVSVRSDSIETLMSFGNRSLQLGQHRFDAIDCCDDVGAGLTLDGKDDGPLLIEPAGKQIVLRCVDRRADVLDTHGRGRCGRQRSVGYRHQDSRSWSLVLMV